MSESRIQGRKSFLNLSPPTITTSAASPDRLVSARLILHSSSGKSNVRRRRWIFRRHTRLGALSRREMRRPRKFARGREKRRKISKIGERLRSHAETKRCLRLSPRSSFCRRRQSDFAKSFRRLCCCCTSSSGSKRDAVTVRLAGYARTPCSHSSRPNQRLRRLETGRPYKCAAVQAVEVPRVGKGNQSWFATHREGSLQIGERAPRRHDISSIYNNRIVNINISRQIPFARAYVKQNIIFVPIKFSFSFYILIFRKISESTFRLNI